MTRKKKPSKLVIPEGKRILALDVASAIGYAYGVSGKVITYGKHACDTDEIFGQRLLKFSKWLGKVIKELPEKPQIVVVELPYLGQNPNTFAVLNRYIGIVQGEIFRSLALDCYFMTPREVKQLLKLPKTKSHAQQKKNMLKRINDLLGLDLKYVPGRGHDSKRSDDDIADAVGLLLGFWLKTGTIELAEDAFL